MTENTSQHFQAAQTRKSEDTTDERVWATINFENGTGGALESVTGLLIDDGDEQFTSIMFPSILPENNGAVDHMQVIGNRFIVSATMVRLIEVVRTDLLESGEEISIAEFLDMEAEGDEDSEAPKAE